MQVGSEDLPDLPGDLVVHIGAAELPGHAASWREALNELSTAEFQILLEDASPEPVDYLADIEIKIDGERAWDGAVVKAIPRGAKVHVSCVRGVSMTETWMGATSGEECPVADRAYALARSAGFSEDRIVIPEMEQLPLESIESVVALQGVEVPGRLRWDRSRWSLLRWAVGRWTHLMWIACIRISATLSQTLTASLS